MSYSVHDNEQQNDPGIPQYAEAEYIMEEPEEEEIPSPASSAPADTPQKPEAPKPPHSAPAYAPVRPEASDIPEKEPAPAVKNRCSGLSIAAFICSLTGVLSLFGFIFSIVDLAKAKKLPRKRGLSVAALILSSLILISSVIGVAVALREIGGSRKVQSIVCGTNFVAGVRKDGTVVLVKKEAVVKFNDPDYSAVSKWQDITALYTADGYNDRLIGFRKDGTIVVCDPWRESGDDLNDRLQKVKDVVSVAMDQFGIYAVKKDGTAEIVYYYQDPSILFQDSEKARTYFSSLENEVRGWRGLERIKFIGDILYGWKKDGSVVILLGESRSSEYQNAVDLGGTEIASVILTGNGVAYSVFHEASGNTRGLRYEFPTWEGIKKMIVFGNHALGLKKDGTVVSVYSPKEEEHDPVLDTTVTYSGGNDYGQCEVSGWKDIVDICASSSYTFGLKKDGTLVIAGHAEYFDLSDWNK